MFKNSDIFKASKLSYVLGKHEWEVTGDVFECNNGMSYTTDIKVIIEEVDFYKKLNKQDCFTWEL